MPHVVDGARTRLSRCRRVEIWRRDDEYTRSPHNLSQERGKSPLSPPSLGQDGRQAMKLSPSLPFSCAQPHYAAQLGRMARAITPCEVALPAQAHPARRTMVMIQDGHVMCLSKAEFAVVVVGIFPLARRLLEQRQCHLWPQSPGRSVR